VAGDVSRLLYGAINNINVATYQIGTGAFVRGEAFNNVVSGQSTVGDASLRFSLDSSRIVPTGLENSPRTLSERFWRRYV